MKSLRQKTSTKLSFVVTGEYGEQNKRPHWHALIFGYWPPDAEKESTTDLGHNTFTSQLIEKIWKKGNHNFGEVTLDSANYVARYAAKKLVHGKDQEHDYHPIHKTSSKNAIGKKWIEKHWKHTFDNGYIVLPNGQTSKIPRYYEDWLKQNHPLKWETYVTSVKQEISELAETQSRKEEIQYLTNLINNDYNWETKTRKNVKLTILNRKFKQLQENLKL
jgi:hypothetical protein